MSPRTRAQNIRNLRRAILKRIENLSKERVALETSPTRTCTGPCGRVLPNDDDHFYWQLGRLRRACKQCVQARNSDSLRSPRGRARTERIRKSGLKAARDKAWTEAHPAQAKIRAGKKNAKSRLPFNRVRQRMAKLAALHKPEENLCEKCEKHGKTKFFFPFSALAWSAGIRVCQSCHNDLSRPMAIARREFGRLFCDTAEDRQEWDEIHEDRLARKAEYDRKEAVLRERYRQRVADDEISQEAADACMRRWELYDAPELCREKAKPVGTRQGSRSTSA